MNFLQTKSQDKNVTNNYDFSYTLTKIRDDEQIVNEYEKETKEIDYIINVDLYTPKYGIGIKPRETILG